jgi:hydroxypyruvate reductase
VPQIKPESFENIVLRRNEKLGRDAAEVMAAALNAVDPYTCVQSHLARDGEELEINGEAIHLVNIGRIYLVGIGKASVPMAMAVLDCLGNLIEKALVVTKDAKFLAQAGYRDKLEVYLGGHPVPTEQSVSATQEILGKIPPLNADDLVIVVVSGGGSALFTDPVEGTSLSDLQALTTLLLKSGADIQEINTIRKHLDAVKGGRLAARWSPAQVQTLILSDVIGDDLDMIASGPTVADPTSFADAWEIITKYNLAQSLTQSIREVLQKGMAGEIAETVKPAQFQKLQVQNHLVGTNQLAATAARKRAEELGYQTEILTTTLTGQTDVVTENLARTIGERITACDSEKQPCCLILGGETTVNVTGTGKGGRNQDLVMRMVPFLSTVEGVLFISLATDGDDGPTDAAGGAADALVLGDGRDEKGLDIEAYIANNDAYSYLQKTGCLIMTGATGTNVNDLIFIFIE